MFTIILWYYSGFHFSFQSPEMKEDNEERIKGEGRHNSSGQICGEQPAHEWSFLPNSLFSWVSYFCLWPHCPCKQPGLAIRECPLTACSPLLEQVWLLPCQQGHCHHSRPSPFPVGSVASHFGPHYPQWQWLQWAPSWSLHLYLFLMWSNMHVAPRRISQQQSHNAVHLI